jgi:hypothetical protein
MKNAAFWDVAACSSCVNRRFGGASRLHLQGRKILERGISTSMWLQTELSVENNQLCNTSVLANKNQYMDRIVREAIETELYPNSIKREGVFFFVSANHGSRSSALIRNLTPDLQGHAQQSSPEATGSMPTR